MSERTLPPTPRKLREARRRGNVPVSRALVGLGATAGGMAALAAAGPDLVRAQAAALRNALSAAVAPPGSGAAPADLVRAALLDAGRLAAAPAAAAVAGALLVGLAQTGGLVAPDALQPRWERLDPGEGLRRLLSPQGAAQAALSTLLAAGALALGLFLLVERAPLLAQLPRMRPGAAWETAAGTVAAALPASLALLAAAGMVDLLLQRRRHARGLRMSRPERDRDLREDEGDPRLRAERRRLHAGLSAAPARATCLVVNPTHVAVALSHRRGGDDPPVVLGKGTGRRALALRREARRLGVPIVEEPALARALFRLADVGDAIPEELYEAAAAVLAHVHSRVAPRRA